MRASEFDDHPVRVDEVIGALISIKNWFDDKLARASQLYGGAAQRGQDETRRFVNTKMKEFMQFMGRYQVDWNTVSTYVVYQFLRLEMKLPDGDIVELMNEVMTDPTVNGTKLAMQQIRDKKTLVSSLSRASGTNKNIGQIIAEKLIAAGAMRMMEKHWEKQAGVEPAKPSTENPEPVETPSEKAPESAANTPTPATAETSQQKITKLQQTISNLGKTQ